MIDDFFAEIARVLTERGIPFRVVRGATNMKEATMKIQNHESLKRQMKAVARGQRRAPRDAALPSFNSVEVLVRLVTPANRELMATLRDLRPQSIAELARMTGRAAPNLTRTLGKLEAVGFIRMKTERRRKIPVPALRMLHVHIDPFSQRDRLEIA